MSVPNDGAQLVVSRWSLGRRAVQVLGSIEGDTAEALLPFAHLRLVQGVPGARHISLDAGCVDGPLLLALPGDPDYEAFMGRLRQRLGAPSGDPEGWSR